MKLSVAERKALRTFVLDRSIFDELPELMEYYPDIMELLEQYDELLHSEPLETPEDYYA